jgi:uncharacterized protein (AIM24 family)
VWRGIVLVIKMARVQVFFNWKFWGTGAFLIEIFGKVGKVKLKGFCTVSNL